METKFNFNSQICTSIIQSERLLALGLKKETADMYYSPFYFEDSLLDYFDAKVLGDSVGEEIMAGYEEYKDYIPAWSLHRLIKLNLLSCEQHFAFQFHITNIDNACDYLVDHIEWLIKEGHFPKEYLV